MIALRIPCMLPLSLLSCGMGEPATPCAQQAPSLPEFQMSSRLDWKRLPAIPDGEGFAGAFSGVSGGALVVAGGANVVGDRWANPLEKRWYDTLFVLENPAGPWCSGFKLPRPLGYGVSITTRHGIVCIGGSDSERHFADVFVIEWKDAQIRYRELPPLPRTCANACGALLGETLYVAGGLESPSSVTAMHTFWSLDLSEPVPVWHELEPWPGPARMLAVAGVLDGSFFLFSGAALSTDQKGASVREFLRDAYRFTPGHGWRRVADMPRPAVAAPSPAPSTVQSQLLIFSGDDGTQVNFSPVQQHPGFPRDVLAYALSLDQWRILGEVPFSIATAPTVQWWCGTVISSGEVRPRVRTPEVWYTKMKGHP